MSNKTQAEGTSPFAHLMSAIRGKRADNDPPEDDEAAKARRAEEDERRQEEDARRAEEDQRREDEDARRAEEDGGDAPADDKDGKKGKRADDEEQDPEADAGDDDDCDGMDDKEKAAFRRGLALGRQRETARATRIFASPSAAGRPDLAATLALTTRNSSAEASRILAASGEPQVGRRRSIDARMADVRLPNPGPGSARKPGGNTEMADFLAIAESARTKAGLG